MKSYKALSLVILSSLSIVACTDKEDSSNTELKDDKSKYEEGFLLPGSPNPVEPVEHRVIPSKVTSSEKSGMIDLDFYDYTEKNPSFDEKYPVYSKLNGEIVPVFSMTPVSLDQSLMEDNGFYLNFFDNDYSSIKNGEFQLRVNSEIYYNDVLYNGVVKIPYKEIARLVLHMDSAEVIVYINDTDYLYGNLSYGEGEKYLDLISSLSLDKYTEEVKKEEFIVAEERRKSKESMERRAKEKELNN